MAEIEDEFATDSLEKLPISEYECVLKLLRKVTENMLLGNGYKNA